MLVRWGIIDATALARAREAQKKSGISLGKALTTLGLADANESQCRIKDVSSTGRYDPM
jgi:hypothetical protein